VVQLGQHGPYAAHGGDDPQAGIYWREDGGWRPLGRGLPEPLPAMPYALVPADEHLFAGLADGQIGRPLIEARPGAPTSSGATS
jgi:hypothetical protein